MLFGDGARLVIAPVLRLQSAHAVVAGEFVKHILCQH